MSKLHGVQELVARDGFRVPRSTGAPAALEAEVAQLRRAVVNRQRIGFVTGLVAERYGLSPDEAWRCLVQLSQNQNVKLVEVARVILDGFCGNVAAEDRPLADRLNAAAPSRPRPLVDLDREDGPAPGCEG